MVDLNKDLEKIIKQGYLEKESRFIKSWRKRWFVLTANTLYTFKEKNVYTSPTEALPLKTMTSIKSCDDQTLRDFSFKIDTPQRTYMMRAESIGQKQLWMGQIGKQMIKLNVKQMDD